MVSSSFLDVLADKSLDIRRGVNIIASKYGVFFNFCSTFCKGDWAIIDKWLPRLPQITHFYPKTTTKGAFFYDII